MTRKEVIDILGHILVGAPHDEANEALAQAMEMLRDDHAGDATKMVARPEDEIREEFEKNAPVWWSFRRAEWVQYLLRGECVAGGEYEQEEPRLAWPSFLDGYRAAERRQG